MAWIVTLHVTTVCLRHVTKLKVYVRLKTRVKQGIWVQSAIKVLYGLNFYQISFTCHQWICFVLLLRRFGSKYIERKRYDFKSGLFLNHWAKPCILSISRRYIRLHIHGRDRMVIEGTTNYAISANHPQSCEFKSGAWRDVHDIAMWLVAARWFSQSTPVSSINTTDLHDKTGILLKMA
jgi:hypothetical protein